MDAPAWEPVWEGNGEAQAQIVADGLDASGFTSRVQGARPIDGMPHAFQRNTWAVFVPSSEAVAARDRLRDQGESAAIVTNDVSWNRERKSTLRFAGFMLLGCLVFALLMALRAQLS